MDALKFSQLLCSRLCHDFINPVGAIKNGFELLQEGDTEDIQEVLAMIQRSIATASQRLIFYRAAFGYSSAALHDSFESLKRFIEDFLNLSKIELIWNFSSRENEIFIEEKSKDEQKISYWSKLLLNLILLGTEGMPYGGKIEVLYPTLPCIFSFNLDFQGEIATVRPEVLLSLEDGQNASTPYTVHASFCHQLANVLEFKFLPHILTKKHWKMSVSPKCS